MSVPIVVLLKAKVRGQRIALRIDGLYFDRLSRDFLATFRWPLRALLGLGLRYRFLHDVMAFWANFISQNYAAFARIVLADVVIYQSLFSRKVHARYFPNKPSHVILNGATYKGNPGGAATHGDPQTLKLVTVYDDWKPAKRIHTLVDFVFWAREVKGVAIELTILGYTGAVPACAPPELKAKIEGAPWVRTLPRFARLDGQIEEALRASDVVVTFSYRDPCPNALIESMAHGLPAVAVASGGVPEICGDAGILVPGDDFADGWYCAHRYECSFPPVNFDDVLRAIVSVTANAPLYRDRVRGRFSTEIGLDQVAGRYAQVLRSQPGGNRGGGAGAEVPA